MFGKTLYDKVFEAHLVHRDPDTESCLLYIDRHIIHEVTSPQAFEGLKNANRSVRRPDCTLATVDHNIPTDSRKHLESTDTFIQEANSLLQVKTLEKNVKLHGVPFLGLSEVRQGIVHIIGPEQGFTLPGTTVVCGDSHTSTHGAFGCLAFGIGTSEVEHVLATQTIIQTKSKNMLIQVNGVLQDGITSKDLILHIIGVIGTAGGTGCVIEFAGEAIRALSMEARMSICNMAIEAGARAGMMQPDERCFQYLKNKPLAPKGDEWDKGVKFWKTLYSDDDAIFDKKVVIDAKDIVPTVTWGTSPQDALPITASVPDPSKISEPIKKIGMERAIQYMGLTPNQPLEDILVDKVFIGSCTNSRIEDLREAAKVANGHHIAKNIIRAMVVPGSGLVKRQAEREGLDLIFKQAGFEWREAGCSMCLGMNPDILQPYERCASTSNRNFEGRQGALGRTHLMSPSMAAATAITGHLTDIRHFELKNVQLPSVQIDTEPDTVVQEDKPLQDETYDHREPTQPPEASDGAKEDKVDDIPQPTSDIQATSAGMKPFTTLNGIAAPLHKSNVDTDAIIPKQFLKTIKRTGLSKGLFYEWRFTKDEFGKDKKTDFILNLHPWDHAEILVVDGPNFGCGSSREHAPWALKDFGITCIVAPSFGDIFYNNCFKNGILPVRINQEIITDKLLPIAEAGTKMKINLPDQKIVDETGNIIIDHFDVEPFRKHCLVNGLDDIGLTLQLKKYIDEYEKIRKDKFSFWEGGSSLLDQRLMDVRKPVISTYDVVHADW